MQISNADQRILRNAIACVAGLVAADSLWTSYVTGNLEPANTDEVIAASDEFSSAIAQVPLIAQQVSRVTRRVFEGVEVHRLPFSLVDALDNDAELISDLVRREGVIGLADNAAYVLTRQLSAELAIVNNGLTEYLSGHTAEGDFSNRFLCGLARLSIATGLVTVWVPPHAHAGLAVKYGATAYAAGACWRERSNPVRRSN